MFSLAAPEMRSDSAAKERFSLFQSSVQTRRFQPPTAQPRISQSLNFASCNAFALPFQEIAADGRPTDRIDRAPQTDQDQWNLVS